MIQKLISGAKLLAVALVFGAALVAVAPQPASATNGCSEVQKQVRLAPGLPANKTIKGTLCLPSQWAPGDHQLDILIHGATYDRKYWDWPQQTPTYSYVNRTLQQGRATFAYDRLGSGTSSRPLSGLITPAGEAYVLHQIIDSFNASYPKITTVGHSFGTIVAIHEAAIYHDADRVVATGLLHGTGPAAVEGLLNFYPAAADPQFFGQILDPGYLTTLPGTRDNLFYSAIADPAVIAYDEAHKDVVSGTFFGEGLTEFYLPAPLNLAQHITAPVLAISGAEDRLTCGITLDCNNAAAVQANEASYYTGAVSITAQTIPGTGHNINLHPNAGTTFTIINNWITTH